MPALAVMPSALLEVVHGLSHDDIASGIPAITLQYSYGWNPRN
jgi:hypothetical protein